MEDITKNISLENASKLYKNFDFDVTKIDFAKVKKYLLEDQKRAGKCANKDASQTLCLNTYASIF